MLITPELLLALGAKKYEHDLYRLTSANLPFEFRPLTNGRWYVEPANYGYMLVTHLEECFGLIFELGKEAATDATLAEIQAGRKPK